MSRETIFVAASEAAEQWVRLLADISHYAQQGEVAAAYALIFELDHRLGNHADVIDAARDALVGASDGIVRHRGLLGDLAFSSAHEAVAFISRCAVLRLLRPLDNIGDPVEWMAAARRLLAESPTGELSEASAMEADIRRERAKMRERLRTA